MSLYRIDSQRAEYLEWSLTGGLPDPLSHLLDEGVLGKVKPCEHGNYARHPVEHTIRIMYSTVDGRVEYTKMDYMLCGGTPDEVNYPTGAVLRSAELAAEDDDPELHHHEVTHSHPFTNLGHTHDQPKLEVSGV